MNYRRTSAILAIVALCFCFNHPTFAFSGQQSSANARKAMGTVKAISGNTVTLTEDGGSEMKVQVQDTTKILRAVPGESLKNATPISLQDLQAGDRILVRGPGDDKSIAATIVIAMKKGDIGQKQQHDLQEWQRHGIGGLVNAVDPASGTVTIAAMTPAGPKTVAVKISKNTTIRRYAPDSVKFDDAKPGTLDEIKPGDQLRARGTRNADGTELAADEVVSGTFRNVAGLVTSVDSSNNTITVNDLATKKPVTIHITSDSQMHKLPPMFAQRLAMRLKGEAPPNGGPEVAQGGQAGGRPAMAPRPEGAPAQGGTPGEGRPAGGDLAQMLSHMPPVTLTDLTKGEAVMVVTTSDATAITLLSGVEPILTASPNGSGAASLLTPWSLGTGGADAAAGVPQ